MDPDDNGWVLVRLSIAYIVLQVILTSLRFWSRGLLRQHRYGWDDWTCLAAVLVSTASCALYIHAVYHFGLGQRAATLPPDVIRHFNKSYFADYWLYATSNALAKHSAVFFYHRIFTPFPKFNYALWLTHGIIIAWAVVMVGYTFVCHPVRRFWDPSMPGACPGRFRYYVATIAWDFCLDVWILVLPLPMLWRLQLKLERKSLLIALFVVGYLSPVVSIGRLATITRTEPVRLLDDPTYNQVSILAWSISEAPIAVIGLCAPAIFQLSRRAAQGGLPALFTPGDVSSPIASAAPKRITSIEAFVKAPAAVLNLKNPWRGRAFATGSPCDAVSTSGLGIDEVRVDREISVIKEIQVV